MNMREKIIEYAKNEYGTEPDKPFSTSPESEVLRHAGTRKWYALFMDVPARKLGIPSDGTVDIVNLKCDPRLSGSIRDGVGIFPAYHMNREKWITLLLDGTVPFDEISQLMSLSYDLTRAKGRKKAL